MAVDGVVGKCRGIFLLPDYLTIRHQPQLDHRLKSVTDTECKTVPFIQQLVDCLLHLCILKCRRKELRASVRLIACWETAREHDNLCLCDCFRKRINRIPDILRRQIAEYFCHDIGTRALKCDGGIILAVCAGEYRYEYRRFCHFVFAYINVFGVIELCLDCVCAFYRLRREYFFKLWCPCLQCLFHRHGCIFVHKALVLCAHCSDRSVRRAACLKRRKPAWRHFRDDASCFIRKQCFCVKCAVKFHAHLVAKCHLRRSCHNTLGVKCISRDNHPVGDQLRNAAVQFHNVLIIREVIRIFRQIKHNEFVPCIF